MPQVDELKTEQGDGFKNGADEHGARVAFNPEQQVKVQHLIDEAYKKAFSKAQRTVGSTEETDRLKSEIEELKEEKKMAAVLRAVSRHNVVDAEEVAELVKNHIKMDEDGSYAVTGPTGALMVNSLGASMTPDEYISRWLSERPHHLRPARHSGAGSESVMFGGGSARFNLGDASAWRSMPREEVDRLLNEGINVHGSAGQVYRFKNVKNPFVEARKRRLK